MPAPTKFTKPTVTKLLAGVRRGLPYHLAASAAGVSEPTFHRWQRGEFPESASDELKQQFLEGLTRAKGEGATRLVSLINTAAREDWRAAAWLLERRYPRDYGKNDETLQRVEALQVEVRQWRAEGKPATPLRNVK